MATACDLGLMRGDRLAANVAAGSRGGDGTGLVTRSDLAIAAQGFGQVQ